jgi:low affinity Fe/Cu permease
MTARFAQFASQVSTIAGSAWTFCLALLLVVGWTVGGFMFGFGDSYQIWINTATTIITFLMVFVLQNSTNRNDTALHLKLDAVIAALEHASNNEIGAERLSDDELRQRKEIYERLNDVS